MDVSSPRSGSPTVNKPAISSSDQPSIEPQPTANTEAAKAAALSGDVFPLLSAAAATKSAAIISTDQPLATSTAAEGEPPKVANASESAVFEEPGARVTLKPKTTERRGRKTSSSEDWFASHGKFIAIGFVVALIGTVYFARTNRQQPGPRNSDATAKSLLADNLTAKLPTETSTSSQVQAVAAVSDSKVELQRPSAPALIASGETSKKSSSSDKLFDFAASQNSEQRVATRPVAPSDNSVPREQSSPPKEATKTLPAAMPNESAPVLAPAYPVTTATSAGYPATKSAALPSNPSAASQFAGQTMQQPARTAGWTPPDAASSTNQYQPFDNTARGPRYERTGSGNY